MGALRFLYLHVPVETYWKSMPISNVASLCRTRLAIKFISLPLHLKRAGLSRSLPVLSCAIYPEGYTDICHRRWFVPNHVTHTKYSNTYSIALRVHSLSSTFIHFTKQHKDQSNHQSMSKSSIRTRKLFSYVLIIDPLGL